MTNSIKLNKDVKKYLKKLYTKGNFSDVKIKDKESDSLSWNNLSITFKFKNGVLLNFWFSVLWLQMKLVFKFFWVIMGLPRSLCCSLKSTTRDLKVMGL